MRVEGDFEILFSNLALVKIPRAVKAAAESVALKMMNDALEEEPKTPWRSGLLRSTGAAFVNDKLVAIPIRQFAYVPGAKRDPRYINQRKLRKSPLPSSKEIIEIAITFNVGYASYVHVMPESNKFSYPGSGPQFVLAKLRKNGERYTELLTDRIIKALT